MKELTSVEQRNDSVNESVMKVLLFVINVKKNLLSRITSHASLPSDRSCKISDEYEELTKDTEF